MHRVQRRWRRYFSIMLHKAAIVGALASILYIVYTSMYKGYILTPMLLILAVLAALYYVTTSVVTSGMVNRKEGKKRISYRAGLVDKSNLIPGRLEFDEEKIVFYKRRGDLGGVEESFRIPCSELVSYSIGKINEYHSGIKLSIKDGEYLIKCRDILKNEALFSRVTGLVAVEEGKEESGAEES